MHLWLQKQCLQRKENEELLQLFVLFLSVDNVLYYISKTVLKNTLHNIGRFLLFTCYYTKSYIFPSKIDDECLFCYISVLERKKVALLRESPFIYF